jgi:REP element-mobilizing transposase RayT
MPRNVYAEINLHITWHTKASAPVLTDAVAQHLYRFIEKRALETPGVQIHAIGGTATHIHLAVSVPPTLEIGRWVGDLKGAGAYFANHRIVNRKLL